MKGPSANIELSGRIGLGDEDFDALVTITPKISSSIPLAGAIAGGPAVGAALFLAQQLMGDSIDRVTRLEYMATGSWDEPILTPKTRDNQEGGNQAQQGQEPTATAEEPDPTEGLVGEEPPSATPDTSGTETAGTGTAPAEEKTDKPSGFFSRLLEKVKPTGPTYPQSTPDKP